MTIADVAAVAIEAFVGDDAITMTAIAGAESAFRSDAKGDPLASFTQAQRTAYGPFASEGFLSFGPWQVFLGVHTPLIRSLSGKQAPDDLARWLMNYANNAQAAREILNSQGLSAWSTYTNGQYRPFILEADAAVTTARAARAISAPPAIVAVSFNARTVHLDLADGAFFEYSVDSVELFGPWFRYNLSTRL